MKKTKTLVAALLAGIVLQQTICAQTNAGDATNSQLAISNEVYDAMVSNVSKMSTGGDQTVTVAASNSTTTASTATP